MCVCVCVCVALAVCVALVSAIHCRRHCSVGWCPWLVVGWLHWVACCANTNT